MATTLATPIGRARTLTARRHVQAALLAAVVLAALALLGERLLADPDTQWHVALGDRIWRDGAVPWTDTYSHTFGGAPWIAKEWLSQLCLAAAHALAGWQGVVLLTGLVLSATFLILFGWLAARLRTTVAFAMTLLAIMGLAPHFLARPLVFGFLALLVWTIGLVSALERGSSPSPWLLLVLTLWANLHGSFTFAYPLAGLLAVEAILAAEPSRRVATATRWASFGVLALAAGCVTPYGWHAMGVTATLFGSGEALPFVIEWQPLPLHGMGLMVLVSAAACLWLLTLERRRSAVRLVAVAGLTAMMIRHGRFVDVFALVAPVLAAAPLLRRWPGLRAEPDASLSWRSGSLAQAALAGLVIASLTVVATSTPRPDPTMTPEAGLAAARRAGVEGPVYNDYDFGGFLIAQGVPTFIDGRTDQLFLGGFISGLFHVIRSEEHGPFLALLDRYGVGWALVRPSSRDAAHLRSTAAWRSIYADETAAVFVRDR